MRISSLLKSSLLIAGAVIPWRAAAGEGPSDVIDLTSANFGAETQKAGLLLVEFFAPWCGHCKALAPHYEEAATALKEKNITLAKVDCVDQADLCSENDIQGYPTLKIYRKGKPTEYGGPRQADGIISYMTKQSLPAISTVASENLEEFKVADKVVVLAYATSTEEAPIPAFSSVAETYRDDYLFGLTTDEAAIKAAGVTPPAIVLYKKFDEADWIRSNAIPLIDEISGENYNLYATSGLPLAYIFIEPTDPKREELIKELSPIAKERKGVVNFVWIDAIKFVEHAKSLVLTEAKWPSFVIQDIKSQLKYPLDQSTEVNFKTVDEFVKNFVADKLQPKLKTEPVPEEQTEKYYKVVGETFEKVVYDDDKDVFVQFSAPWCGHCKRLLPTWETLAETYADRANQITIAKMDATENDLPPGTPFHIAGYPTLKFKPAGSREFFDYDGDRSLESLIEFVESKAKNDLTKPVAKTADPADSAQRPAATLHGTTSRIINPRNDLGVAFLHPSVS
ncbi:thioredoxin-like protein [Cantharellus anzutake]|uniref:thioredoxin-like protein n=1 Tax=Cantharellus anzutake TaxID=1750568 RepID=UPI001906DCB8|nr:thioredoxin-like protein [Cantharellus anzutake]KAF8332868.1 thioredoxin-like protein [Cantharellus anzutake]